MNYSKLKLNFSSIKSQLVHIDKHGKILSSKHELIVLKKGTYIVDFFPFLEFYLDDFLETKEPAELDCVNINLDGKTLYFDFKLRFTDNKYLIYFENDTKNYLELQAIQQDRNESVINSEHQQQAQKSKELFFQKVNHEIRNPLQSSLGLLNVLEDQYNFKGNEYWDVLKANLHSLKTITNDILDLSKVEEGRMKLYNKRLDLHYFLHQVYKRNKLNTRQNGNKLVLNRLPNQNPVILIDETRLHQVFYNIISNANKYTKNGKIFITIQDIKPQANNALRLSFSIKDTGNGMPKEKAKDIFEDFVQIHDSTIPLGVGLGLSIVKQIVQLYNGKVWAESAVGIGTEIHFSIEVREAASLHQLEIKDNLPSQPLRGKDILLIEDDPMNALIFSKLLQILGGNIDIATNEEEIINALKSKDIDLVFTDYHLESNLTILDIKHKLTDVASDAKWILVSGDEFEQSFLEEHGFNDSLVKPISLVDVKKAISSLL